jgi:hypothetical protein
MINIAGHSQQTFENTAITQQCSASSKTYRQKFEFSLKVMGLNPGHRLESFLLY